MDSQNITKVKQWFEEETIAHIPYSEPKKLPRHQRLSYLIAANGGPNVKGWGVLSSHNGHQMGLEQSEAIELIQLNAFILGLDFLGVDTGKIFKPYFDQYVKDNDLQDLYEQKG